MPKSKTLNFDDEVIDILKNAFIVDEAENVFIGRIQSQLSRDLYIKVNKALEAFGGKWDRKSREDRKAKSFRAWFERVEGISEMLPESSFRESSTNVHTRMVVIKK